MIHNTYTHTDGTVGVGFLIDHAGVKMHSIAWPNKVAERMTIDEIERKGVEVGPGRSGPPFSHSETIVDITPEVDSETEPETKSPTPEKTESELIREFLTLNPDADNLTVIEALAGDGVKVIASQVGRQRNAMARESAKE